MTIMRAKEMRQMDDKELAKRMDELKLEIAKSRAQVAIGGAPQNPGRIGEIKRTIARALTIKKERGAAKTKPVKTAPQKKENPRGDVK